MSAAIELDAWQAVRSHAVNCNKGCSRKKIVCAVGKILLAKALAQPEQANKPRSFPFVAKLLERIGCNINGTWTEAVVRDRSLSARKMYRHEDWKTGELGPWRTAQSTVVGYEVETDDKERHYVRPNQVRSLRKRQEQVSEKKVPSSVGQALRTVRPPSGDLIILRRG